jgi:aminoglycoside phosphotransferase (APT) family kinase protein
MTTATTGRPRPAAAADSEAAQVADLLQTFLTDRAVPGAVQEVRRAGSGRSRDNWLFDLVDGDSREPLILRVDPDGGLIDTDRGLEFEVLRRLESTALPTPVARWLDAGGEAIGRPALVMRRIEGSCDYRVLGDEHRSLAERTSLAQRFCELLADVHAVDWQAAGLGDMLADPGPEAARAQLEHWVGVLRQDQLEPWPELDYAAVVLAERAPRSSGTVLVHADFKPGNILLVGDRITALLDWELAHLGDPLEDLGWVTQPLRRGEHAVDKLWEADDLVRHYEQVRGTTVDRTALRWWVAFSAFKTAVMQVSGLRAFVEGRADEPYRPTRRVVATVLDAVLEEAR